MAGLQTGSPTPVALTVHSQSHVLEIAFSDGAQFRIPFELMRIDSPSAEVQGHGPGQEADYIVVEMANQILGKDWLPDYVALANHGGIERVLV